jgi:hypothetical protein
MLSLGSMDPFVRRLIQRLQDPSRPLSRNRHFHTFDNPEGRYALRISRRLRALQRDILACRKEGQAARYSRCADATGTYQVELVLERVKGRRVSVLADAEFELLNELPGVRDALRPTATRPAEAAGSRPG